MKNDNVNVETKKEVRPVAASQARELSKVEVNGVGGGWPTTGWNNDCQLIR